MPDGNKRVAFLSLLEFVAMSGMWSLRLFPDRPAAGFGAAYFLISVGQLVGPLPAGLLAEAAGLEVAFYAGAALTFVTLVFVGPRGTSEGGADG